MVAYWKFEEPNGSTAYDSVANNDGAVIGGGTWVTGLVGAALRFDGINDYIEVPDDPSLRGMAELTVEAWAYPETLDPLWQGIVVKRDNYTGVGDFSYGIFARRGWDHLPQHPAFELYDESSASAVVRCYETHLVVNQWYHFAAVYSGDTAELYINGVSCNEVPFVGATVNNSPHRFLIGTFAYGSSEGYHFKGLIDEVAIYRRALSPEEVQQHHQDGLEGKGYELAPTLSCAGFDPPMGSSPVTVRGQNRALPLKAQLFDADSLAVTDLDLSAPPAVQVIYQSGEGGEPVDVTGEALPAGHGSAGNQFEFTVDQIWQFNLKTRDYTAPGTYFITYTRTCSGGGDKRRSRAAPRQRDDVLLVCPVDLVSSLEPRDHDRNWRVGRNVLTHREWIFTMAQQSQKALFRDVQRRFPGRDACASRSAQCMPEEEGCESIECPSCCGSPRPSWFRPGPRSRSSPRRASRRPARRSVSSSRCCVFRSSAETGTSLSGPG
jgi:hypothetical protein